MKSNFRRLAKITGWSVLGGLLLTVIIVGIGYWYFNPPVKRSEPVVYGSRESRDLTFEIATPKQPNGAAVIMMMSGSWKSNPDSFKVWIAAPLLRAGYTIFAVSHISQPVATVQDTVLDIHRAVRFIRHHADEYEIDPDRIGVTGASSGGHLSLNLVTRGGPGDGPDSVEEESSEVQAAAVFFPVTNLFDLGKSRENAGDGGPPKSYRDSFGEAGKDLEKWKPLARELSPVYHVTEKLPPTLIFHGDKDTLVPLEQSEWFLEAAEKVGAKVDLRVRPGKRHGWLTMPLDIRRAAKFFDEQL